MPLDVTDIVQDPDFATQFSIIHVTGSFNAAGEWVGSETADPLVTGIILPAKWDQLQVLPEGERHQESIVVYSSAELTIGDQQTKQADIVLWDGSYYRVVFMKFYPQASVWFAIAERFHRVAPTI